MEDLEWHTEERKINDLVPTKNNPRQMTEKQIEHLQESLEKFNLVEIPAINKDNTIIAGHQRLKILQALGRGEEEIEVRVPNRKLTVNEHEEYMLRSNQNTGEWDFDAMSNEFDVDFLKKVGFTEEELDFELPGIKEVIEDNPPEEERKTDIQKGDLLALGEHRLLCGDATKEEDLGNLMNGEKADMVFTDPPYLMNFKGSMSGDGSKGKNAKHGDIENDSLDPTEEGIFLAKWIRTMKIYLQGSYYICFYEKKLEKLLNALNGNGLPYRNIIIWYKNHLTLNNSDYNSIYEPVVYGWNEEHNFYGEDSNVDILKMTRMIDGTAQIATQGGAVYFRVNGTIYKLREMKSKPKHYLDVKKDQPLRVNIINGRNDIWEIARVKESDLHPTMKPLQLSEKALKNSSKPGDIVLDQFAGSGSTLITAEQLNRKCYVMELSPKYCQIIIDRWEEYTGLSAERLG